VAKILMNLEEVVERSVTSWDGGYCAEADGLLSTSLIDSWVHLGSVTMTSLACTVFSSLWRWPMNRILAKVPQSNCSVAVSLLLI